MAASGLPTTTPGSPDAAISADNVGNDGLGNPTYGQYVAQKENPPKPTGTLQAVTVDATVGGVALASVPSDAECAHISLETAPIRWTDDGSTAPTASVGHLLTPPSSDSVYLWIEGRQRLLNFKAIRTGATSGALQVTYYKRPWAGL